MLKRLEEEQYKAYKWHMYLPEENREALILGCTELPLILNEDNCPVECIDVVDVHIKELAKLIAE